MYNFQSLIFGNFISYTYAADGRKLQTVHTIDGTVTKTDYVGNMIYENDSLKRILVDGGYYANGEYYFYLQDHLGNNCVVAKADGTVVQTNDYYPFGMEFASNADNELESYKYNGKELDTKGGLNLYDYGARHYDAALGRFTSLDPMAEKYYSVSPYVYCGNNPIMLVDVNGKEWGVVLNADGTRTITLAVNFNVDSSLNLTSSQISGYKTAISAQLNNTFQEVSEGAISALVTFGDGNFISYTYAADGRKLQTVHTIDGTVTKTDYVGNMIYENDSLKRILVDGGYYANGEYYFYLQDHLGNNRVVAKADGTVVQTNDYYPFGMEFTSSTDNELQPYKYNGKELDTKDGLNLYDYGARHYDAALGRFTSLDPMAEKYYSVSPYAYCNDNPICNRDEEGKFINNIIGAVVGGVTDLGIQVAANIASNNSAFHKIDWISVGASTVEGGLTSGLSIGKTLAVKTGVAIAKNTINGMKDGANISGIVSKTVEDVLTDKMIGKAGNIVDKGVKKIVPEVGKKLNQLGNKVILSNNKATKIMEKMPGVPDVKTARDFATSENGLVDASKSIGSMLQKIPEKTVDTGMKICKMEHEKEENQKK